MPHAKHPLIIVFFVQVGITTLKMIVRVKVVVDC